MKWKPRVGDAKRAKQLMRRRKPGRPVLRFRDLVEPALEGKLTRGNRESSVDTDRAWLKRLLPLIGGMPVKQLTPAFLEGLLERLARGDKHHDPVSGATVNRYRSCLSSIFAYAVRKGHMKANPLAGKVIPWSKEAKLHVRYLGQEEERRLLEVIRQDCPEKEPELVLALTTGARRGELWGLLWSHVHFDAGLLDVSGKTGARVVRLNDPALMALGDLAAVAPAGQVFVTPERNDVVTDRRTWLEKAIKKARLEPRFRGFRDLRHTFASRCVQAGATIQQVQLLLGHANIQTTMRYAHLSAKELDAAAAKVQMSPNYTRTRVTETAETKAESGAGVVIKTTLFDEKPAKTAPEPEYDYAADDRNFDAARERAWHR